MTIKRQIRTRLLKALRRIGLLCAKTATPKRRIRISKTVFPDGTAEEHGIITKVPENAHSFESELHIHNELQKSFKEKLKKK
tara:strand:+ start:814 stop:1059 length:246 start_codon:yes stop_codon:yes gene_type:complete